MGRTIYEHNQTKERFIKVRYEYLINAYKLEYAVAYYFSFEPEFEFKTKDSVMKALKFRVEGAGYDNDVTFAMDALTIDGDYLEAEALMARGKEVVTKLFPELYTENKN